MEGKHAAVGDAFVRAVGDAGGASPRWRRGRAGHKGAGDQPADALQASEASPACRVAAGPALGRAEGEDLGADRGGEAGVAGGAGARGGTRELASLPEWRRECPGVARVPVRLRPDDGGRTGEGGPA